MLRLYAILNSDLIMSPGKAIAQAGHAYTDSLLSGLDEGCEIAHAYASLRPGTKVTLQAPFSKFETILWQAQDLGLRAVKIVDSGHVHPPHFDGSPVWTAIGLGPVPSTIRFPQLRKLSLWQPSPVNIGESS